LHQQSHRRPPLEEVVIVVPTQNDLFRLGSIAMKHDDTHSVPLTGLDYAFLTGDFHREAFQSGQCAFEEVVVIGCQHQPDGQRQQLGMAQRR